MRIHSLFISCLVVASTFLSSPGKAVAGDTEVVERWLSSNGGVGSIMIEFSQSRSLRSLAALSGQKGTIWINYNNGNFRWETGEPAATIVVGGGSEILIVRPGQKKYERRKSGSSNSPGIAALADGLPQSMSQFQAKYKLLGVRKDGETYFIDTEPKGSASKEISKFTFVIHSGNYRLVGIELDMQDGSSMHTVFTKVELDAATPGSLFRPDLSGYQETKF
jgi:outer membrane lipoprotein-sorting protein